MTEKKTHNKFITSALIAALIYLLLVGVGVIGSSFKWLSGGAEGAKEMFQFASNPMVGVILGVLATAVVQSSSTVTSVIVGLVAAGMDIETAIPMVMGANMGTTITNTIVSFGNISEGVSFRRSFAAATVHDFFNLFSIIIFLPIELVFHPLEFSGKFIANFFVGGSSATDVSNYNFVKAATSPVIDLVKVFFKDYFPESIGPLSMIVLGVAMVILSVVYMGRVLKKVLNGKVKNSINKAFGKGVWMGVLYGTVITVLVQSSSTTTSLIIPLAAAGVLSLKQIFPFTLGANIGTCITAVMVAVTYDGNSSQEMVAALQIAMIHLLYNVFGVVLFLSVKFLKNLPIKSAEWLAAKSQQSRMWAFGYILSVFFILPGLVFAVQNAMNDENEEVKSFIENNEIDDSGASFEMD